LEPRDIDNTKCIASQYSPENIKDIRCSLTNIHKPENNIKWTKEPLRILTKEAIQIFNDIYVKFWLIYEYKKVNHDIILNYQRKETFKLKQPNVWTESKKKLENALISLKITFLFLWRKATLKMK
jgi:hypothetical protein